MTTYRVQGWRNLCVRQTVDYSVEADDHDAAVAQARAAPLEWGDLDPVKVWNTEPEWLVRIQDMPNSGKMYQPLDAGEKWRHQLQEVGHRMVVFLERTADEPSAALKLLDMLNDMYDEEREPVEDEDDRILREMFDRDTHERRKALIKRIEQKG